jgi:adenylate kinase
MDIVLFGKPGSGKGTQAPRLAEAMGAPTLATGDVLRGAVRGGTTLGLEAKAFMDRGDLVPDNVILGIIGDALRAPQYVRGSILDGVVRTVPQAEGLRDTLAALGRKVDAVLTLEIDDDDIVGRMSSRTVCEACQTPYAGRAPGEKCTKCGGKLVRRKDDEPEAVRNRLSVYRAQTAPVLDWYRQSGARVVVVDAVGSVDEITQRALAALRGDGKPAGGEGR